MTEKTKKRAPYKPYLRASIKKHWLRGLKQVEIAELLGVSTKVVSYHVVRIRKEEEQKPILIKNPLNRLSVEYAKRKLAEIGANYE